MNKLLSFLSFLASRQFLAFLALIVVALVIWFLGPFIAFGGLKPLAGPGMRVVVIALLLAGVLLWLARRSTSVVFAALLCLLIWYASPLLAFGRISPFEPVFARLIAMATVLAVFVIYWGFLLLQKMRDDDEFLKKLLRFGGTKEASPAAKQLQEVDTLVASALARMKSMRTGARGLGKLFQGKRYLYELPWYITLGSNTSGKTTMLLNGGLSFPVAEQMQRAAGTLARDATAVDWWLTNDAVLIDTAGYYARHGTSKGEPTETDAGSTDQPAVDPKGEAKDNQPNDEAADGNAKAAAPESKSAAPTSSSTTKSAPVSTDANVDRRTIDKAEWLGFLGMLRRHRPRAPINGALLTVDLAELASVDEHARIATAAALRARLAELRAHLGIRFPVYLLITKTDLLPGFAEYFGSLTSEGRAQTWGFTLPYDKETIAKEGLRARSHHELTQLAERLDDAVDTRLRDEYDFGKRRRLAAVPEEFAALIAPLVELIDRVFLDSRYDDTQLHSTLRGSTRPRTS